MRTFGRALMRALVGLILALGNALRYLLTLGWIRELIELARDIVDINRRHSYLRRHRRGRDPRCKPECGTITPDVYRRPDPMIYSQRYLREQGLAVTWNNPDIQLYLQGTPVASSQLEADTEYEVRATVWNNSTEAPAVGLDVDFYYHDFGIGPNPILVGSDTVTLPVKGAPGHPVVARSIWRTPRSEGHYCLKVQLNWTDDANPKNNLGQENTTVGTTSSPAVFRFPVRNEAPVRRVLELIADAYTIPPLVDCRARPSKKDSDRQHPDLVTVPVFTPGTEQEADWTNARFRHSPEAHQLRSGWVIDFEPETFDLAAGEAQQATVSITPPSNFTGRQAVNVNAVHGTDLIGGVTLFVDVDQEARSG